MSPQRKCSICKKKFVKAIWRKLSPDVYVCKFCIQIHFDRPKRSTLSKQCTSRPDDHTHTGSQDSAKPKYGSADFCGLISSADSELFNCSKPANCSQSTISSGLHDSFKSADCSPSIKSKSLQECLSTGLQDCLSTGPQDLFSNGLQICLSAGPQGCRSAGPHDCLSAGPHNCVSAGPHNCVSAGPHNCVSSGPQDSLSAGPHNCVSSGPQDNLSARPHDCVSAGPQERSKYCNVSPQTKTAVSTLKSKHQHSPRSPNPCLSSRSSDYHPSRSRESSLKYSILLLNLQQDSQHSSFSSFSGKLHCWSLVWCMENNTSRPREANLLGGGCSPLYNFINLRRCLYFIFLTYLDFLLT